MSNFTNKYIEGKLQIVNFPKVDIKYYMDMKHQTKRKC